MQAICILRMQIAALQNVLMQDAGAEGPRMTFPPGFPWSSKTEPVPGIIGC